jgi:predicted outer membrane protein
MTFKPALWYPIAVVLSAINLVAAGFAASAAEPWHATTHAALAVAFGLWAQHLRQGLRQDFGGRDLDARLEALELEVSEQRRELSETQERVDFAERLLAQGQEARRVEPER